MTCKPDEIPSEEDRQWYASRASLSLDSGGMGIGGYGESYRVLPDENAWAAWRILKTKEGRFNVETLYPLGRHDTPAAALDACRTDAVRRHRDREANEAAEQMARIPLDPNPPPVRDNQEGSEDGSGNQTDGS